MNKTRELNPHRHDVSPRELGPRSRARLAYTIYKEGDHDRAMSQLCEAFHVLRGVPGTKPYDREKFKKWLGRGEMSSSMYTVACFVLSIGHKYPIFDFGSAFQNWDKPNREAFIGWCETPWYP